MTIENEINRASSNMFRRFFVKRRLAADGLFETDWQDMTTYVKNGGWGIVRSSVDDQKLNRFTHSGINLRVRNDEGRFNPEDNATSFWNGYLTRYRTLVKIEAGYLDDSEIELPTDSTQGIFIMNNEIPISAVTNDAVLKCTSLITIFDEVRSNEIAGLGATQTAGQIIELIRDHTDGSGNLVFQQFITAGAWNIDTSSTNNFNLATSTSLVNLSTWKLMEKIAEAEGNVVIINRTGGVEYKSRAENTTTSQFDFNGQNFPNKNIIGLLEYKEALNKYFNFFRLEYTTTTYVTAGTTTTVNPSDTAWKFGSRVYNFKNSFFETETTAQTIVDNLLTEFNALKEELTIKAIFAPQLDVSDKVQLSYRSYDMGNSALWDTEDWDVMLWSDESGENFNWENQGFKIISKENNLNNFVSTFKLREL